MDQAQPVTLKKYGNRRLYDTSSSRYVTLSEVEAMVQGGRDIVVVDAKTGEDLTKEVMVQLILEREGARAALPVALLKQVVKLANSPLKDGLVRAMQDGLDGFLSSQRAVVDAQRNLMAQMGAQMGAQLGQMSQLSPWVQPPSTPAAMWNPFPPPPAPGGQPPQMQGQMSSGQMQGQMQGQSPPAQSGEYDALKAELAETQTLVRRLLEREAAPKKASTSKKKKASTSKKKA